MSETVNLVLKGLIEPSIDQSQAVQSLAALFRIEQHVAETLLAKAPTIIKKELPAEQLPRYIAALNKAGFAADGQANLVVKPQLELVTETSNTPLAPTQTHHSALQLEAVQAQIHCPQCGYQQAKRTLCQSCGCDMPRVLAAQSSPTADQSLPASTINTRPQRALQHPQTAHEDIQYHTPSFWNIFDDGRLGRVRFLAYSLLSFLPFVALGMIVALSSTTSPGPLAWIALGVVVIWAVIQSVRLTVLRLHDMNKPTSWAVGLMVFNMLTNAVGRNNHSTAVIIFGGVLQIGILLALTLISGDEGENDYGNPAAPPNGWHKGIAIAMTILTCFAVFNLGTGEKPSRSSLESPEVKRTLTEEEVQQIYQQHRHLVTEAELSKLQQALQLKHPDANIDREELRRNLQKEIDLDALDLARKLQNPNPSDAEIPHRQVLSEQQVDELMKQVAKERDITPKRELVRREAQYLLDQEAIKKHQAAQYN